MDYVKINTEKDLVLAGIRKNAEIVGSTMGPYGRNVTADIGVGMITIKDGVTVSKMMAFEDEWERMGSLFVTGAARLAVSKTGDGTTATAVLTLALCEMAYRHGLESEIRNLVSKVVEGVREMAIPIITDGQIDEELLRAVAKIAANSREDISDLISDVVMKIGVDGQIMVEPGDKLEMEILDGYGYEGRVLAQQFLNLPGKMEIENCQVALINEEITDLPKLNAMMKAYNTQPLETLKPLVLIVGGMNGKPLATFARAQSDFQSGGKAHNVFVISAPGFAEQRHAMMEDLSVMFGCRVFNHMRGVETSSFTVKDFGFAKRIAVKNGRVFCFSDTDMRDQIAKVRMIGDKKRLALLTGGIGVIRVGGTTEQEASNNLEIVDDCQKAVWSALEGGVVPGGGRCLDSMAHKVRNKEFARALRSPKVQIWKNAGLNAPDEQLEDAWHGLQIEGEESVDFLEAGIIDPANVIVTSLESAASAAIQFLTTDNFIIFKR